MTSGNTHITVGVMQEFGLCSTALHMCMYWKPSCVHDSFFIPWKSFLHVTKLFSTDLHETLFALVCIAVVVGLRINLHELHQMNIWTFDGITITSFVCVCFCVCAPLSIHSVLACWFLIVCGVWSEWRPVWFWMSLASARAPSSVFSSALIHLSRFSYQTFWGFSTKQHRPTMLTWWNSALWFLFIFLPHLFPSLLCSTLLHFPVLPSLPLRSAQALSVPFLPRGGWAGHEAELPVTWHLRGHTETCHHVLHSPFPSRHICELRRMVSEGEKGLDLSRMTVRGDSSERNTERRDEARRVLVYCKRKEHALPCSFSGGVKVVLLDLTKREIKIRVTHTMQRPQRGVVVTLD